MSKFLNCAVFFLRVAAGTETASFAANEKLENQRKSRDYVDKRKRNCSKDTVDGPVVDEIAIDEKSLINQNLQSQLQPQAAQKIKNILKGTMLITLEKL